MPQNKNAIIRYKILDELLSDSHHYYTRNDLHRKCNEKLMEKGFSPVSKRTIELDLHDIDTEFDEVAIDWDFVVNGNHVVRYEDQSRSIFTHKISQDEAHFLFEVLETMGQFTGLEHFEWLDSLQARLKCFLTTGNRPYSRQIMMFSQNRYLANEEGVSVRNILPGLFQAIANKVTVEIEYRRFCSDEVERFIVFPYMLKQYNDRWYLICKCTDEEIKNLFNLPLDRIFSFCERPEIAYEECNCDLNERYEDIVGVTYYMDHPVEVILFAVSNEKAPYIITKPIHGSQRILTSDEQLRMHALYPALDNYLFFALECIPNNELKETLYSFDKDIVVLHPAIREEIQAELTRQLNLYNSI